MRPKPDSIAAIATAPGRGGIGVVRVSGHDLAPLALSMLGKTLIPRLATCASFFDAQGLILDQGLALFFPAPHSYTGEDVLEFQGHGGVAVLQMVLQRCVELGARLAQPGEFTQRAFLNNKLDLAQAESVADLIDATTSQSARSAMRSLHGEFSQAIHRLLEQLIHLRMLVEAMLDFPEEEIGVLDVGRRDEQLNALQLELDNILRLAQQGSLLRQGAHIVLVGQPNVGKSSLLNCLSKEEVALVSSIPGTTRDVLRQAIQICGVPLHILDTAGLRESHDEVEQMGMARTRSAVDEADAILIVMDSNVAVDAENQKILNIIPPQVPRLYIHNKVDLLGRAAGKEVRGEETHIYLSAKTGAGIELLQEKILTLIGWQQEAGVFMARERHVVALRAARKHLQDATLVVKFSELLAEELRLAQESLNTITGEFNADDLLGEIFSSFCIGK